MAKEKLEFLTMHFKLQRLWMLIIRQLIVRHCLNSWLRKRLLELWVKVARLQERQ